MPKKSIDQIDVAAKRVLMRVDFNVPLDEHGAISDDRRIRAALPSIRSVIDRGGRLILMSHLGRPDGTGYEPALSLSSVVDRLAELLDGATVNYAGNDCVGDEAARAVDSMQDGEVVVLENVRFQAGEKKGDGAFAAQLAAYGDIYSNDAFGTAHRTDASMVAVPMAMEGKPRVAGLLLNTELSYLGQALTEPHRPFVAVLGGAKVSDKIGVLHHLMGKVDTILVGGAMAYTLMKAMGNSVGTSLVEADKLSEAKHIIDEAAASPTDLHLPQDHICGRQLSSMTPTEITSGPDISDGWMGLDIGPKTGLDFMRILRSAKTIVWNGPMGAFELPPFDVGTNQIAQTIIKATEEGATSVVGGGDSAAAVDAMGLGDRFTHVSTGGGASLRMLEGRPFSGVELLDPA